MILFILNGFQESSIGKGKMQTPDTEVSVIVNTYNHEKFILRCIEGIINQKFDEPIEIIVIDDASSDSTLEILEDIEVPHNFSIKVIALQNNEHSAGLWPGLDFIKQSKSDFLAFCDGDDYWIDDKKIAKQIKEMRNGSNVGLVHTDYFTLEYADSQMILKERTQSDVSKASKVKTAFDLLHGNNIKSSTALIRREMIDFSFFEGALNIPAKDWLLFLTVVLRSDVHFIDERTTVHRVTSKGIWNGINPQSRMQIKDSIAWYCAALFPEEVVREAFRRKVAIQYFRKMLSQSSLYRVTKPLVAIIRKVNRELRQR